MRRSFYLSGLTNSNRKFENSKKLKHYIFLKEHEVKVCEFRHHSNTALLERATVMYLKALLNEDVEVERNLIQESISYIDNIQGKMRRFHEDENKINWGRLKNIIQGTNYELMSSLHNSLEARQENYKNALEYYSRGKHYRSWIISNFIEHNKFLLIMREVAEKDAITLIKHAEKLRKNIYAQRKGGVFEYGV